MERLRGTEALKNYSFRDIALPFDQGLDILTQNARQALVRNLQVLIDTPTPQSDEWAAYKERLKQTQANPETFISAGGLSFSEDELLSVYSEMGNASFKDVVNETLAKVPPTVTARGYPNIIIGYTLDLLSLIKPETATFDDGVSIVLDLLKTKGVNMFEFGAMVDDAIKLRGTPKVSFDLLGDNKGAEKLRDSIFKLLTPEESMSFAHGLQITRNELMRMNKIQ